MRVTAILTAAERKRQDRSVHRAEERRRRAKMMRVCGPTCPHSSVWAHASAVQAPKRLINKRKLAILTSNGMPLGECRIKEARVAEFRNCLADGRVKEARSEAIRLKDHAVKVVRGEYAQVILRDFDALLPPMSEYDERIEIELWEK